MLDPIDFVRAETIIASPPLVPEIRLHLASEIVPLWLVWAYAGFRGMMDVWPAALVAGVSFAVPQFLVSNYHGPWLVDVVAAVCSITGRP